ncbi:SEL1-like repeat protein [Lysobacter claricitrinus]|uniref:hypothetical protein n=1 Tax=Lysobacter claricitrinus TaxID=3367728 RepID=UPI0038B2973A
MLLAALACTATAATAATPQNGGNLSLTHLSFNDLSSLERSAKGRPNEEARLAALKSYVRGDMETAADQFRKAAYYADKFSQHALSLMYWQGVGVPRDPVQAYIWADLAAERPVKRMLLVREKIWSELTPAQQKEAVAQGESYYDRYGDAVAQPRTEGAIRLFLNKMTGSHIGFQRARLEISGKPDGGTFAPQVGGAQSQYVNSEVSQVDALYPERAKDFAAYWHVQDLQLSGAAQVGGLQEVKTHHP